MYLTIPTITRDVLNAFESSTEPTVDYELSSKLSGLHQVTGLTEDERKGAWAEAAAFNFMPSKESPWGTHFGPVFAATKPDGTPVYGPDVKEIDAAIVAHWEERSAQTSHPVMQARYADLVWDLKKTVTGEEPSVGFAQRAIDAYLAGVTSKRYKEPLIHAASPVSAHSNSHCVSATKNAFKRARPSCSISSRKPSYQSTKVCGPRSTTL
jgi:lysyl-tRNA synthetase class 1